MAPGLLHLTLALALRGFCSASESRAPFRSRLRLVQPKVRHREETAAIDRIRRGGDCGDRLLGRCRDRTALLKAVLVRLTPWAEAERLITATPRPAGGN